MAWKWAQIAEQYQAEYFAPQNEFNGPIRGNFAEKGAQDYIFIAWLMPGMEIKDRPAEAVMKEYFKKI